MTKLANRLSNRSCPEDMTVEEWQIALRREQAIESDFIVEHLDDNRIWGDYLVSSPGAGGRYKVAFRGVCSERNYCSCLDFRTNALGTCKHLEGVTLKLQEEVEGYPWSGREYNAPYSSVFVSYKGGRQIRMRVGTEQTERFTQLCKRYFNEEGVLPLERYIDLANIEDAGASISSSFRIYEDVFDFAKSELAQVAWQQRLKERYPDELIPYSGVPRQEQALYQLCFRGNALVVAPKHQGYILFVSALMRAVYANETQLRPGYIIVDTECEAKQWSKLFAFEHLPVEIMTAESFMKRINSAHPSVCFVWVDNARSLRDWKDNLSHAIKKLSIDHLYMRIETAQDLSPIQLSSTLQHISPYLLGPLYRFVHNYRHTFPLLDDGSNAPQEVSSSLFFITHLFEQSTNAMAEIQQQFTSEEKVVQLFKAMAQVLDDPKALDLLRYKVHEYIDR